MAQDRLIKTTIGQGAKIGVAINDGSYNYYNSIQDAIYNASAGDSVELFADYTTDNEITLKDKVNIDLNGHKITTSNSISANNLECSIINGKIIGSSNTSGATISFNLSTIYFVNCTIDLSSVPYLSGYPGVYCYTSKIIGGKYIIPPRNWGFQIDNQSEVLNVTIQSFGDNTVDELGKYLITLDNSSIKNSTISGYQEDLTIQFSRRNGIYAEYGSTIEGCSISNIIGQQYMNYIEGSNIELNEGSYAINCSIYTPIYIYSQATGKSVVSLGDDCLAIGCSVVAQQVVGYDPLEVFYVYSLANNCSILNCSASLNTFFGSSKLVGAKIDNTGCNIFNCSFDSSASSNFSGIKSIIGNGTIAGCSIKNNVSTVYSPMGIESYINNSQEELTISNCSIDSLSFPVFSEANYGERFSIYNSFLESSGGEAPIGLTGPFQASGIIPFVANCSLKTSDPTENGIKSDSSAFVSYVKNSFIDTNSSIVSANVSQGVSNTQDSYGNIIFS